MKTKKFIALTSALALTILTSCSGKPSKTSTDPSTPVESDPAIVTTIDDTTTPATTGPFVAPKNFEVKVIDIDGEETSFNLNNGDTLEKQNNYNLLDDLSSKTTVITNNTYGMVMVDSIAGSVIDNNYYLALYENGEYSMVGVSDLVIDDGDVFTFKVESYKITDEVELALDKYLYSYSKTYFKDILSEATSYKDLDIWSLITLNLLIDHNYDDRIFNSSLIGGVKDSLVDLNPVTGAQLTRYYLANKILGKDLTDTIEYLEDYYSNISTTYSDYVTPFEVLPAIDLGIKSTNLDALILDSDAADTTWGNDALNWQLATRGLYDKTLRVENDYLASLYTRIENNNTSNALALLSFASLHIDPREDQFKKEDQDLIEYLVSQYNEEIGLIPNASTDTGAEYGTAQIYASLFAYKVFRDELINKPLIK